jgi:hypothetical protein
LTLLTFNSKHVVTSATAVSTASSSLVDDTQASQTFILTDSQTVLVIYAAYALYGSTSGQGAMENAISVDSVDKAMSWDSSAGNFSHRNCCFWVGTLAAGSHTIKGRFASKVGTQTTDGRVLLIYILNGDEFQYVDDATTATNGGATMADDAYASVTFTPSGTCKLLALYNTSNSASGETNYRRGKKVAISIAGADYGQAERANEYDKDADSEFTCHALQRTAISTTVKGRWAGNIASQTTTVTRRQLAVLCFEDATLMDVITSTTQVTTYSGAD